jgi:hypothetical protein
VFYYSFIALQGPPFLFCIIKSHFMTPFSGLETSCVSVCDSEYPIVSFFYSCRPTILSINFMSSQRAVQSLRIITVVNLILLRNVVWTAQHLCLLQHLFLFLKSREHWTGNSKSKRSSTGKKGNAIPVTGSGVPYVCEMSRLPH